MSSAGAETVYDPESPTIPDTKPKPTNNGKAGSSDPDAKGSTSPGGEEGGVDGESGGTASPGNGDDGPGQGNGGNGSKTTADISSAEPVQTAKQPEDRQVANESAPADGSSSSLVPILIAIAALAAVSIGAVVIRQRRGGGPGKPVSPKAS